MESSEEVDKLERFERAPDVHKSHFIHDYSAISIISMWKGDLPMFCSTSQKAEAVHQHMKIIDQNADVPGFGLHIQLQVEITQRAVVIKGEAACSDQNVRGMMLKERAS